MIASLTARKGLKVKVKKKRRFKLPENQIFMPSTMIATTFGFLLVLAYLRDYPGVALIFIFSVLMLGVLLVRSFQYILSDKENKSTEARFWSMVANTVVQAKVFDHTTAGAQIVLIYLICIAILVIGFTYVWPPFIALSATVALTFSCLIVATDS